MNVISIHQPNYLPWLGFFYKIYRSDIFVFLDDVQFSNEGAHNYCYIKTSTGKFRLKIPVGYKHGDLLNTVSTKDKLLWKEKHFKTIELNYKRAPFFKEVIHDIGDMIFKEYPNESMCNLNAELISLFAKKLGFKTRFMFSSELQIESKKEEKVIDICKSLHADVYYSGTGARAYQNEQNFSDAGVSLLYSDFVEFEYPQLWGQFEKGLSVVDYLMNCGYDQNLFVNTDKIS